MASKTKHSVGKHARRNTVTITGTITLGGSGAISAQDSRCATFVKKPATTGCYTGTFDRGYKFPRMCGAPGLVGPTSAAFGNTNANMAQYRNLATAAASTFDIQLLLASTGADTDGASGTIIHWSAEVQEM